MTRSSSSKTAKEGARPARLEHPLAAPLSLYFGKALYLTIATILVLISVGLIFLSLWNIWKAVFAADASSDDVISVMLDAVGLTVLALAVIDVSKYFFDEEVIRERELRGTAEARGALTKFLTIITIAVSLEAVVLVFQATKETSPQMIVYPALLLFAVVLIVTSLGLYQFLSSKTEKLTGSDE